MAAGNERLIHAAIPSISKNVWRCLLPSS